MSRKILSASVSVRDGIPAAKIRPTPGINILRGEYAEDIFWAIAGIFDVYPKKTPSLIAAYIQAEIQWPDGVIYGVTGGECGGEPRIYLDYIKMSGHTIGDKRRLAKRFCKRRFLDAGNRRCTFEGKIQSCTNPTGESDLRLGEFYRFLQAVVPQEKGRPLFLCNFLERLDESVDLRPVFEVLNSTGRQVFIAVPHYYNTTPLEEMPYETTIHSL